MVSLKVKQKKKERRKKKVIINGEKYGIDYSNILREETISHKEAKKVNDIPEGTEPIRVKNNYDLRDKYEPGEFMLMK